VLEGEADGFRLIEHAVGLGRGPRVCHLPTATGDDPAAVQRLGDAATARLTGIELSVLTLFVQPSVSDVRAHLLAQDVILVNGGSVVNLVAVWRAHGLPEILRECWEAGVVLERGQRVLAPRRSDRLLPGHAGPVLDGLGFLPYSNGVHDDFAGQPRRQVYRELVANGTPPPGYASEDGVGLHYVGTELHEAVTVQPGARSLVGGPQRRPADPGPDAGTRHSRLTKNVVNRQPARDRIRVHVPRTVRQMRTFS
jgi:hypothetical protein